MTVEKVKAMLEEELQRSKLRMWAQERHTPEWYRYDTQYATLFHIKSRISEMEKEVT